MSSCSISHGEVTLVIADYARASELDFLAGRTDVARRAAPSVGGELEGAVVFVAEERSGLAAPVAADDVWVAEAGVGAEESRGYVFFVADQVVAAKDFPRGRADDLPGFLFVSNVHEDAPRAMEAKRGESSGSDLVQMD